MNPILLAATSLVALHVVLPAQVPQIADRSYFTYGSGIGNGGFRISAVNGVTELLVPCGNGGFGTGARYWILHRYDQATSAYQQVFCSPVYAETDPVMRTAIGDVDAASGPEIVVVTRNGTVEIWNQASRSLLRSFTVSIGEVRGLALADVDADLALDVVLSSTTMLHARTAAGVLLWSVANAGGNDVVVAQMDGDPALEAATTSGRVVDCATQQVQFHWQNGFGIDVDAADIDGDGRAELVFAEDWNWVWAFDIDTQLPKWSLPLGDVDCLTLANVDADPAIEVLVGEGQWGDVRVFDSATQQQQFLIHNAEHGVTSIAAGDVDGDGQIEVVFGAGWTSTGPDFFYVASAATQAIEWTSPSLGAGFVGPVRGDLDGDGNDELVCATTTQNSSSGARLLVFDEATLALEHVSGTIGGSFSSTPYDLALADVDADGDQEVFLVTGGVTCLEWTGTTFGQTWQLTPSSTGPSFREVEVANLDADPALEVVLGSTQFVHVYEYGAATEAWRSFYLGGDVKEIALGDSDVTPGLELHALSSDGNVYVFDGASLTARAILQDGGVDRKAVHVVAGVPALITGDNAGNLHIYVHDGTTYFPIGPLPIAPGPVHSIAWLPALGVLQVSSGERLALQYGLTPAWRTANYGPNFADKVSIDLGLGQIATAGVFGLSAFYP